MCIRRLKYVKKEVKLNMAKTWMRGLEIIAGVILLVIAVWFVFNPSLGVGLVRTLLAIGLMILGLVLVVRSATPDGLSAWARILNVILGIIVLACLLYTSPSPRDR